MYELEQVTGPVHRIALEKSGSYPPPVDQPNNVYLLDGRRPALINAGHPTQFDGLCQALHEVGVAPSRIHRVVHTSWRIDVLGAAASFPDADHFVLSPDMIQPRDYEAYVERQRSRFVDDARSIVDQHDYYDEDDLEQALAFAKQYWPRMTHRLDLVPIRSGHTVAAGELSFEVIETPGANPGNTALYDSAEGVLFCGDITLKGMPDFIDDVQPYLVSLERLLKIEAEHLLPNFGPASPRSQWMIKRALSFLNNFLSNAPAAMHEAPTVLEFIETDRGHRLENLAEMVFALQRFRRPMDELARARMIETEGKGLSRRYGVDVDDPRNKVRD
jgi:glyoxylase-like metal-dependent hydrolase (beta-lactamase superfamily II)